MFLEPIPWDAEGSPSYLRAHRPLAGSEAGTAAAAWPGKRPVFLIVLPSAPGRTTLHHSPRVKVSFP